MKELRTFAGVLALLISVTASPARADELTLRWQHPTPADVAGFTVHIGHESGVYEPGLGLTFDGLQPGVDGIYTVTIEVESDRALFVALRAFNDDGYMSGYSNEGYRYVATPLGQPGRPRLSQ